VKRSGRQGRSGKPASKGPRSGAAARPTSAGGAPSSAAGDPGPQSSEVVELSRFRAGLSRGRRLRRADLLFAAADPRAAVRELPGDEFYYVIHELGFPDAVEILGHGTAEQVQAALDFGLWDRDQLSDEAVEQWLGAMVEAPSAAVAQWARGIDVELLALLLRRRARIYDLTLEEAPEGDGAVFTTPDTFFALELLGDEDAQGVTLRLLNALYTQDHPFSRKILVGTRGELDAELEEQAYRWRSGRMADLGFSDYYDALEVYREIDPASVRVGGDPNPRVRPLMDESESSSLRMPSALVEKLGSGSPFARAITGVSSREELANLQAALVALSNRVLAADRVTPGDDETVGAVLGRMTATLDLAIELLSHGRPEEGVRAVQTVPLTRLFQLGVSLVGKVRRLAQTLRRKTPFSQPGGDLDLFEARDAEVLEACTRLRPMFPRVLDTPPAGGERPFSSLEDLRVATAALERIGAALTWLLGFGVRPEDLASPRLQALGVADRSAIDTGLLARTLLARELLREAAGELKPLDPEQVSRLEQKLAELAGAPERAAAERARLRAAAEATWPKPPVSASALTVLGQWIDGLFSESALSVLTRQ
jgi:hypothetical protein